MRLALDLFDFVGQQRLVLEVRLDVVLDEEGLALGVDPLVRVG